LNKYLIALSEAHLRLAFSFCTLFFSVGFRFELCASIFVSPFAYTA